MPTGGAGRLAYSPTGNRLTQTDPVTGDVTTLPDTFGAFIVKADDGSEYAVQLDVDLNRRGYSYPVGSRLQVTGPVLYSYSEYSIAVMSVGQITEL